MLWSAGISVGWVGRRVLDVTAVDDEESEDEEEGLTDIVEDDGDEDFAPGVEGKPKSVKAGSLKTKERPKSRGTTAAVAVCCVLCLCSVAVAVYCGCVLCTVAVYCVLWLCTVFCGCVLWLCLLRSNI